MSRRNGHSMTRILTSMAAAAILLAVCAYGQDRYVDPERGNNFNDGLTCATAWATVNFALTGPQAPLPAGTVIHLCGTNGIACSLASGESFPWVLYNNISIVADPCTNSGGTDHIIDAAGSGQDIIVLDGSRDFFGNRIAGIDAQNLLVIKNGNHGIVSEPAGKTHAPVIEYCRFENMTYASIWIKATAGGRVGHNIHENEFKKNGKDSSQIAYRVSGAVAAAKIENNTIEKDDSYEGHGIYLNGTPSGNETTVIENNTITGKSADSYSNYYGIYLDAFTGRVEFRDNTVTYKGSAVYIKSCNPWHPLSRIENNACRIYWSYYGEGCIVVNNTDDVTIRSCTCDSDVHDGIKVYDSHRVVLEDNVCSKCSDQGIYLNNAKDSVLRNNTCDSNENKGIYLDNSDGTLLEGNVCTTNWEHGIDIQNGSSAVAARGNECTSNGQWGIFVNNSNQVTVEENLCEKNVDGGIWSNCAGTTITANTVRKNTSTGICDLRCDGTLIASNLVASNGNHGIILDASSTPNMPFILHNTVVDNLVNGLWTALPSTSPPYVANNIFWGSGGNDIAGLAYGQYWCNDIQNGGSPGYGNISKDPLFLSASPPTDYHLSSGSPCIDAGTNFGVKWGTDLDGAPRVLDGLWQGWAVIDMGAFEFHETDLAVSGTFQPGGTLDFTVTGPQGASFRIYAAAGSSEPPLAAQPGLLHPHYGTFLLDPARLLGVILSGTIPAGGTITVPFSLPGGAWNRYVGFQAAVDYSSVLAGQFTRAVTGRVTP